mmetsp:Transcript_24736/g.54712  ORF Transcript_24736/g.54712 Transcript_24736/m.54712 type:complete len:115 (-) Transcript_24736:8-352(-)
MFAAKALHSSFNGYNRVLEAAKDIYPADKPTASPGYSNAGGGNEEGKTTNSHKAAPGDKDLGWVLKNLRNGSESYKIDLELGYCSPEEVLASIRREERQSCMRNRNDEVPPFWS